jgi:uncharacterized protein with FMN-binding domain
LKERDSSGVIYIEEIKASIQLYIRAYPMKKSTLSFWFVVTTAVYVGYLHLVGASDVAVQVAATPLVSPEVAIISLPATPPTAAGSPPPQPSVSPAPPPTPTPVPKPKGLYADGVYTGGQADAYYGMVQVQTTIQKGKIARVQFLQYPNDRRTSQSINGQAMPLLETEALQVQNANVNIISGATDTSMAFQQSLADALAQAKS